jgi:hypothetical protein
MNNDAIGHQSSLPGTQGVAARPGLRLVLTMLVVLMAGALLRLAGVPMASAAAGTAGPAAASARARQDVVEQMVLSRKAIFSVSLIAPASARAREKLDTCEERFREGADKSPDDGSMATAVNLCMRTAAELCQSWPDPKRNFAPSLACGSLHQAQPGLWSRKN